MDFTVRIHKDECGNPTLSYLRCITISGITIISKPGKFDGVCMHTGNQRKYGYKIELSRPFNKISGSNSFPSLSFNGEYIDIDVKNFPRYPAFYQDQSAAIGCLKGYGYGNYLNDGFPHQLLYRKIEILIHSTPQ
ncbi:MAG: hypothetical protein J7599_07650 [Niabella sp.]|nr:hypothetical protein [Niabella sp.]